MGIKPLLAGDYIQPFDVYHAERQVKGKTLASTSRFYCGTEKKWYIKKLALRNILGKNRKEKNPK